MSDPIPDFGLAEVWARSPELGQSEYHRRVFCARWGMGDTSVYKHRKWITEKLWPEDVYIMHEWSDRRLKSTCNNSFVTWWGPGGCGKTTDAAAQAIEYWLEDPANTAVIVCSTTKDMLRRRIWGEICRLWHKLPAWIAHKGDMLDTACMIRWEPNDAKNGIFGVAVDDGPVEDAINNLIGIHTKRVWLIIDEMQGTREAIMGALPNMTKNPESRFLGMGNPTRDSILESYSTPINGGWSSIEVAKTESWPIDPGPYIGTGRCHFFDGRKSPAYLDENFAVRNPWMINKNQIDAHARAKGENSPDFWTQSIGWPPPIGVDATVLDRAIIDKFLCKDKAHWTDGFEQGAVVDPAFTFGGDSKVLQRLRYGIVDDREGKRWVIELLDTILIPIDVTSKETVDYQIVYFVRDQCKAWGIRADHCGTDSTGSGKTLLSVFRKEWGEVVGIEFGGAPSDMTVDEQGTTARERFDRKSSELNIMVRDFAYANGIRGLGREAEDQFCKRMTTRKGLKYSVESKEDFKKRLGFSPGESDAAAMGVHMARLNGAVPGQAGPAVREREHEDRQAMRREQEVFSDEAMLQEETYEGMEWPA